MYVTGVSLRNFLSYTSAAVEFTPGTNVVFGANAAGKTNLADAVYLASLGRSSRLSKDKELIKWGTEGGASVSVRVNKMFSAHNVDVTLDASGKKKVLIDRLPVSRIGELMGVINTVFFSPGEVRLVRGAPEDRRRFLDMALSQESKTYFYTLKRYFALLAQRNRMLKDMRGKPALDALLNAVDPELQRAGAYITRMRSEYVEQLLPLARAEHFKLTKGGEELSLKYESFAACGVEEFAEKMKAARQSDERLEFTTVGAHRDDLKIVAGGIDLRKYGSQGQQRTAVLSMKLAEIAYFKAKTGETPVLILDDVLSELDSERRSGLFEAIRGVQTILTGTEAVDIPGAAYYLVSEGKVIRK